MPTGTYRDLMDPDLGGWEVGDDPEHPGRFYATLRWDDTERKIHESITAVNEDSFEAAIESVLEERQHMIDHPELHHEGL